VTNLMNALEGAAVSRAAANGAAAPAQAATPAPAAQPAAAAQPQAQVSQVPTADQQQATQIASLQSMGKEIAPHVVSLARTAMWRREISMVLTLR
jgi:hypothetical protein